MVINIWYVVDAAILIYMWYVIAKTLTGIKEELYKMNEREMSE